MPKFKASYEGIGAAMRSPQVRAALRARAERIAAAAKSIDAAEGGKAKIGTGEGTHPNGRPFARATSDAVNSEFGTSKTARRRTLGRAADTL
jgi:hypothetical protein